MQHKNLASERTRLGLTQTQLAEALGTNIKAITRYERNTGLMPADFVKKASEFFGCSADYLLDATEERLPHIIKAPTE